jgi:2-dehydro-3-deoxy-L-rhamnonate dehydrogenase (NAD+)
MTRFAGQVALLSGGAGALGLGIARRLAAEGAALALLDCDAAALERAVEALAAEGAALHGGRVQALCADVTDEAAVARAVDAALARHGRLDVLVTAHGINGNTTALTHELPVADFARVLAVDLRGVFLCDRAVLPAMRAAGYGRIVNLASIAGKEGNVRMLAYSAAKAGVIGLTQSLGRELAGTGIACNAVAPALVRTGATAAAHDPARFAALTATIPMGRTGEIAEVAAVVAFAASRECSFTTGFCFDASGGRART